MKLHLPTLLRRALLTAVAVAATLPATTLAGVVRDDYAVQDYLDIAANAGQYTAGATNVQVYRKDGSLGGTLTLIPTMSPFIKVGNGDAGLVLPQYAMSAAHVKLPGEDTANIFYYQSGHEVKYYGNTGGGQYSYNSKGEFVDTEIYRLTKIVTEATYAPMSTDDAFLYSLPKLQVYRLGTGMSSIATDAGKEQLSINGRPHGGTVNVLSSAERGDGAWFVTAQLKKDEKNPLGIADDSGDSGSPVFAFNETTRQFETVAAESTGTNIGWNNFYTSTSNATKMLEVVASMTDAPITAAGADGKVLWNVQGDADHGTLTQGETAWEYHGKTSTNSLNDTKDLVFAAPTSDTVHIELQGNINNGAGSVTFKEGSYTISSAEGGNYTLDSAGFIVERGAWLTTDYTGKTGDDWRKVGEGVWTIAGSGDNLVDLKVGGGVMRFDENLNIIREGEVRLNRTDGVAADKVTLSAGIASVVLMSDEKQFNSFAFGVGGGILNLNGHNQEWNSISHIDNGAMIANLTPLGENTPQDATFTYTGIGTYLGGFADEGADGAKLKVVYNNAGSEWTLAGQSATAGGFEVQHGTLALQGTNTLHVNATDTDDWSYAVLETSAVTVKDGANFRLGHHALMTGEVNVEGGGTFILNSTVNKTVESVHGSQRQDVTDFVSLRGNVNLAAENSVMRAETNSPVATQMEGNITGAGTLTKSGSGDLIVNGRVNLANGGTITAGGLVVTDKTGFDGVWQVGADGFIGVKGMTADMLAHISADSAGVLALGANSETELNLTGHEQLTIGALDEVQYGTETQTLTAYNNAWRLGGGGGNLFVNFKLSGENDLIIGTEASSGTVTLTNNANDFSGNIIINGTGNMLRYDSMAALGSARVNLTYGNGMAFGDAEALKIIKDDSAGVLNLRSDSDAALDLSANKVALGAEGAARYTGTLTANKDGVHRFSGSGTLVVDTALSADRVEVDGQGQQSGTVVLAKEYNGTVTVGGGLQLANKNASGSIRLQTENNALAHAAAVELQKGAVLEMNGVQQTVRNLTAQTGSAIVNRSATAATLTIDNTVNTTLAAGTLQHVTDGGALNIVKTGTGTLTFGNNNSTWVGSLTINEGKVVGYINDQNSSSFGATSNNAIVINENGTLRLTARQTGSKHMMYTRMLQPITGTGTLELSSGASGVFLSQSAAFNGTVKLMDNTRMNIGVFQANGSTSYNNNGALANATIVVESGSQARITNQVDRNNTAIINNYSDYVISGNGFAGAFAGSVVRPQDRLTDGALSIDCGSVLHGDITLAENATIASWTNKNYDSSGYGTTATPGGTILGTISGEGKTLTKAGNERISLKADAANSFGDFVIAGGAGSEGIAVRLEQGAAKSTQSTALGMGKVTLNGGLTLAFDNAGTADRNITYSYANAISAGDKATLKTTHNTTSLGGLVSMTGSTLNLGSANGAMRLEQGVSGNGTIAIADGSDIALGGATAGQFKGTIAAGANSTVSLLSGNAVGAGVNMSFTDSLNLHIADGGVFHLDSLTGSGETQTLNLTYDVFGGNGLGQLELGSALTANTVNVSLDFTHASGITAGTYTLLSGCNSGFEVTTSGETGVDYMSTAFSRGSDGSVLVTLALKDDTAVWNGSSIGTATNAVFNDTAANKNVNLTDDVSFTNALIHSQEEYTFTNAGGKASIGTLTQIADGTTVLEAGAAVVQTAVVNGGRLVVQDSTTLTGTVSGSGTLVADFGEGSGTISANMTGLSALEVQSGRYESSSSVGASTLIVKDGGQYYANGGTHSTAMQVEGTGRTADKASLQLTGGATVSGTVTAAADTAVGVNSGATGTISGKVTAAADTTLTKTGAGTLVLGADNSATLTGKLVIADGTVKLTNALGLGSTATAGRVVITDGGALDINGVGGAANNYHVEMNGGTLTNTGATVDTGKRQVVSSMTLTADSTVNAVSGHDYGLIGSSYNPTAINLQGHTLEKTGDGTYSLVRTTITGGEGGKLKVSGGTLAFNPVASAANGSLQADIEMAGGSISGNLVLGSDMTLSVTKASTLGANITTNGHAVTFDTKVAASYANTISGNGALVKTGAAELTFAEAAVIRGNDLAVKQGTVTVKRNATDAKSFGTVQLAKDTTLKQYNSNQPTTFSEVDTLVVGSSATLQEDNHAGAWKVNTLKLAAGTTSATLNLTSSASSSYASVYELGAADADGGDFAGEIVLKSTNASNTRTAVLQISNGEIAAKARVNLLSTGANNDNQKLGLGINAERVTIAGLDSGEALGTRARVFSGSVNPNTNNPAYTGDDTVRTLAIDTAAGTDAHFRGMVGKNLNIEKLGEGTQILSGNSAAFNGDLMVNDGMLKLQGDAAAMMKSVGSIDLNGGKLVVDSLVTLSATEGTSAHIQKGSTDFTADVSTKTMTVAGATTDVKLDNTAFDIANGATLKLQDLVLGASSRLLGEGSAMVNNVVFEATEGINAVLTAAPAAMLLTVDPAAELPKPNGTLTLTNIQNVTVGGENLTIDLSSIEASSLNNFEIIAVELGEGAQFAQDLDVWVRYGNSKAEQFMMEQGVAFFHTVELNLVPEPATTTLSLLALAALAARRRRK